MDSFDNLVSEGEMVRKGFDRVRQEAEAIANADTSGSVSLSKAAVEQAEAEIAMMEELNTYISAMQDQNEKLQAELDAVSAQKEQTMKQFNALRDEYTQLSEQNASSMEDMEYQKFTIELFKRQLDTFNRLGAPTSHNSDSEAEDLSENEAPLSPAATTSRVSFTRTVSQQPTQPGPNIQIPSSFLPIYEIPSHLKSLHSLVMQYSKQGIYEVAVPLCKEALEKIENKMHPDVASVLSILSLVYRDQHKVVEATVLLEEALRIREEVLGLKHPATAATLNNLAILYAKRGKLAKAQEYCEKALAMRKEIFGHNHPDVARQTLNLALIHQNRNNQTEAEECYEVAVGIYMDVVGCDHPVVAQALNHWTSSLIQRGEHEKARALYERILLQAHEKQFGSNDKTGLAWLNGAPVSTNSNANLTPTDGSPYSPWQKIQDVNDPVIRTTLENLATIFDKNGNKAAAQSLRNSLLRLSLNKDGAGTGQFVSSLGAQDVPPLSLEVATAAAANVQVQANSTARQRRRSRVPNLHKALLRGRLERSDSITSSNGTTSDA